MDDLLQILLMITGFAFFCVAITVNECFRLGAKDEFAEKLLAFLFFLFVFLIFIV